MPIPVTGFPTATPTAVDGLSFTLADGHAIGDGVLSLQAGAGALIAAELTREGLPALSPTKFAFVVAVPKANFVGRVLDTFPGSVVFKATGLTGNVLAVAPAFAGTDAPFDDGDTVGFCFVGAHVNGLWSAVLALKAALDSVTPVTAAAANTFTAGQTFAAGATGPGPGTGTLTERFGAGALGANTTGSFNAAFGTNALAANTTGTYNAAFGPEALKVNTTGVGNMAVGMQSLVANTTGGGNVAIGQYALSGNVDGDGNIAIGTNTLTSAAHHYFNVAIGNSADSGKTGGDASTALGYLSGTGNFSAATALGQRATCTDHFHIAIGTADNWTQILGDARIAGPGKTLGFYGATPITKPSGDVATALSALGLIDSPTVSGGGESATATLLMPPDLYAVVGHEISVYFDNVVRASVPDGTPLDCVVTCLKSGNPLGSTENERWTLTAVSGDVGTYTFTIAVFWGITQLATATCTLHVKAAASASPVSRKVLVIGDSTSANGARWPAELINLCNFNSASPNAGSTPDNLTVSLVGTRDGTIVDSGGTSRTLATEAISGWTAAMFYANGGSPFVFSGAFNFGQYLSTNSITLASGDWVLIHLGINDMTGSASDADALSRSATILSQLDAMITSIRGAVSGVRVGVLTTIPPAGKQDAFRGQALTRARYKRSHDIFVAQLITHFSGQTGSNVFVGPLHTNLDCVNNMQYDAAPPNSRMGSYTVLRLRDPYHPEFFGQYQIADAVYAFLRGMES